MINHECMALLLAGGRGTRLGPLTKTVPKPAVSFGGAYRMIDFALSNCLHSGLRTVGVLTQYLAETLHDYIGSMPSDRFGDTHFHMLPPRQEVYWGTSDAIAQNLEFIDWYGPRNVVILAGDHVYKMDYRDMLHHHFKADADCTLASVSIPRAEASRYGILSTDRQHQILTFEEKPRQPKSNLASMGIYIFKWSSLRRYLLEDQARADSTHDFGADILPAMLADRQRMVSYPFCGYWRDIGCLDSLWQANMDLLSGVFSPSDDGWSIYTGHDTRRTGSFVSRVATLANSIIGGDSTVMGKVYSSVLSDSVFVGESAEISNSVIMPSAHIGEGAVIDRAIIGSGAQVPDYAVIRPDRTAVTVDDLVFDGSICLYAPGQEPARLPAKVDLMQKRVV